VICILLFFTCVRLMAAANNLDEKIEEMCLCLSMVCMTAPSAIGAISDEQWEKEQILFESDRAEFLQHFKIFVDCNDKLILPDMSIDELREFMQPITDILEKAYRNRYPDYTAEEILARRVCIIKYAKKNMFYLSLETYYHSFKVLQTGQASRDGAYHLLRSFYACCKKNAQDALNEYFDCWPQSLS